MIRNSMIAALGAAAILSAASALSAQTLAVPGKTPANPTLVVSIPDTALFWNSLTESRAGKTAGELLEISGAIPPDERSQIELSLGTPITTANLLSSATTGIDAYFITVGGFSGMLFNIAFTDAAMPGRIMDHLKREAAASSGVSGGIGADTVSDNTSGGVRTVYLPAFEIFLAADGNVLTYSTMRLGLESALNNEGRTLFDSEFFVRSMSNLSGVESQLWAFGEMTDAAPLLETLLPRDSAASVGSMSAKVAASKLNIQKDRVQVSTFVHQDDMPMAQRRYAMTAPPAGDVRILNYFGADTLALTATNHFDGLSLLETMAAELGKVPGAPITPDRVEEGLRGFSTMLGFDLRNDLLANLGPHLGFSLKELDLSGPTPRFDFLLATSVKDQGRFGNFLEAAKKALDGITAPPAGQQAPAGASPYRSETYQGATLDIYTLPLGPGAEVTPTFTLTPDGIFLFALSESTVKGAIDLSRGGGNSVLQGDTLRRLAESAGTSRNSVAVLDMARLMAPLEEQIGAALLTNNNLSTTRRQAMLELLKSTKSVGMATTYKANGKKDDVLLFF